MVFEHHTACFNTFRFKNTPNDLGILINDGREGNDVNNSVHAVSARMVQRKPKACECLAAARWYG